MVKRKLFLMAVLLGVTGAQGATDAQDKAVNDFIANLQEQTVPLVTDAHGFIVGGFLGEDGGARWVNIANPDTVYHSYVFYSHWLPLVWRGWGAQYVNAVFLPLARLTVVISHFQDLLRQKQQIKATVSNIKQRQAQLDKLGIDTDLRIAKKSFDVFAQKLLDPVVAKIKQGNPWWLNSW